MDDLHYFLDDDCRYYEYQREIEGLRKQNDSLREMLSRVRTEINGYRSRAEEAEIALRQMEEARAGVTGARLFFQRTTGGGDAVQYHYTADGTRARCRRVQINPAKWSLVELPSIPELLCASCASLLKSEIEYNPYQERDDTSLSSRSSRKQKTVTDQNEAFFRFKPDPNPLFTTYVYLIQSDGEAHFKVGISTNPRQRLAGLRHAAGRTLKVLFLSEPCTPEGARAVEYEVRREFDRSRVAQEWYRLSWQQVKRVKEIITLTVAKDRSQYIRKVS